MNAYEQGKSAYLRGKYLNENPYYSGTPEYMEWRNGWFDAEAEVERK